MKIVHIRYWESAYSKLRVDRPHSSKKTSKILLTLVATFGVSLLVEADDPLSLLSFTDASDESCFAALKKASPFRRTLNFTGFYALRGFAVSQGVTYARVYDSERQEILTVSSAESANGMKLLRIIRSDDMFDWQRVEAEISLGGEIFKIRYNPELSNSDWPAKRGRVRISEKSESDVSDDRRMFESQSDVKKKAFREDIKRTVVNHPNLSEEHRVILFRGVLKRLSEVED